MSMGEPVQVQDNYTLKWNPQQESDIEAKYFIHQPHDIFASKESYTFEKVFEIASSDHPVVLEGLAGSGKGFCAKLINALRKAKNEVVRLDVDATVSEPGDVDLQLFGASTGQAGTSKLDLARGGTLFIPDIGQLHKKSQLRLRLFLEEGRCSLPGGREISADEVKIVAGSRVSFDHLLLSGKLDSVLYYRLAVFYVLLPPLNIRIQNRQKELFLLIEEALFREYERLKDRITDQQKQKFENLTILPAEIINTMFSYAWPGGVRELRSLVKAATVFGKWDWIPERLYLKDPCGMELALNPIDPPLQAAVEEALNLYGPFGPRGEDAQGKKTNIRKVLQDRLDEHLLQHAAKRYGGVNAKTLFYATGIPEVTIKSLAAWSKLTGAKKKTGIQKREKTEPRKRTV